MIVRACLCADLPTFETETRIVIVSHVFELARTTNTARLARLMLPKTQIVERGAATRISPPAVEAERAALLFPEDGAIELDAFWAHADPRPLTLVVPDGSWPQAKRAARRTPGLAGLPRVRLPDGPPTRFLLRDQTRTPQHLCTLEAIARALGIIEGHRVEAALLAGLDRFILRILASRGRLSGPQSIAEEVRARVDPSGGR